MKKFVLITLVVVFATVCTEPHRQLTKDSSLGGADTAVADAALADAALDIDVAQVDAAGIADAQIDAFPGDDLAPTLDIASADIAQLDQHVGDAARASSDAAAAPDAAVVADVAAPVDSSTSADSAAIKDITVDSDTHSTSDGATTDAATSADGGAGVDVGPDSDVAIDAGAAGPFDATSNCKHPATCVGAPLPTWKAQQVHPKAKGYTTVYGLDAFKGTPTFVALLAAW